MVFVQKNERITKHTNRQLLLEIAVCINVRVVLQCRPTWVNTLQLSLCLYVRICVCVLCIYILVVIRFSWFYTGRKKKPNIFCSFLFTQIYFVGIKSRIIYFKQHALILKWIIVITNGNGICNGMDFADFLFCTLLTV